MLLRSELFLLLRAAPTTSKLPETRGQPEDSTHITQVTEIIRAGDRQWVIMGKLNVKKWLQPHRAEAEGTSPPHGTS